MCRYSPASASLMGGKAYERDLYNLLSEECTLSVVYPHSKSRYYIVRWLEELEDLSWVVSPNLGIRDFYSTAIMGETTGKDVSILHHIDGSQTRFPLINKLLERKMYQNLLKLSEVVVVSRYWKDFLEEEKGFDNVRVTVIYNGFDLSQFNITEEEKKEFKERYGLRDPIYIGNCHPSKGVVESYKALKDYELVTSGERHVKLPVKNLELSYREYLTLLSVSRVVLSMSKFKEGWNRTLHEAMLCETPVIGSGSGGMTELLTGGGQVICDNFRELPNKVSYVIENREYLSKKGYEFAKEFTLDRFNKEWRKLMESYA